jgi:hypothetical protein
MPETDSKLRTLRAPISSGSPAFIASILGLIVGALMICSGVYLMVAKGTPMALDIAVSVVGLMEAAACYYTIRRYRVAWSFAISINATAAVVFLFSSARIRDAAGVHIVLALVPCLIFGLIVVLQAMHSEEF